MFYKCYKVCFFPSHTTITLQQVLSLPSHTTCKFSPYFVNKLCWNSTDLGIGPSHFEKTTQQSPPSIQRAYNTLYITGSSHTLHSVYYVFSHTSTSLSIGGSMATHLPFLQRRPSSRLHPSNEHTSRSTLQGVLTPYIQFTLSFHRQILT